MSGTNDGGRREPPLSGDETATLLGSLERQRATLAWKCGGLDAAGARARLGPSEITLGGLLKHLALVEDHTFATKFLGRGPGEPWESVDWDADPDWEWRSAADDSPEDLLTCGGRPSSAPAASSPARSPTAAWTGWAHHCRTGARRACAVSS